MDFKKNFQEPGAIKNSPLPNAIAQNDHSKWTALHEAAATGDENKCQALLTRKFERTAKSSDGNTPLHEAAWRGYSRCVKILCTCSDERSGAKDKKSKVSKTANTRLASTFLDIQNNGGFTALHLAAQNGHNQSCRELLLAGADPDIKNNYGDTPLHTSCRYGHAGATRILISAECDPNKVNLNGDHPLHITCAMGRRKLTRLLLEADCDMTLRNAQGETPRDIAKRKNFTEILDILKNPQRIRNRREKPKQQSRKSSLPDPTDLNSITWSPYGCHYFPDPRSFPSPKLETLPKEPLKKGEQYYLDLAGHIRKGPIGIGNTCYCGPFFKHIEHKINSNRKSLRKYVHKTKECLDNKVQELALRTIDNSEQIEQLTRSIIADRVRCESRRIQLSNLIKRGEPLRSTTEHQLRSKRLVDKDVTLERSRSMEVLDKNSHIPETALSNAKSCGGFLNEACIIVHQRNNTCSDTDEEEEIQERQVDNSISADSIDQCEHDDQFNKHKLDICNATDCLSELLKNANFLNEIENENSTQEIVHRTQELNEITNNSEPRQEEHFKNDSKTISTVSVDFKTKPSEDHNSRTQLNRYANIENVTESNGIEQHLSNCNEDLNGKLNLASFQTLLQNTNVAADVADCSASGSRSSLFRHINGNEYTVENVISALHKDQLEITSPNATKISNETESIAEDKLSYKNENVCYTLNTSFLHSKAASKKQQALYIPDEVELPGLSAIEILRDNATPPLNDDHRVNGKIEKIEVKNSEIKMLKKSVEAETTSKRSRVQELVARLQGKLSTAQILSTNKKRKPVERRVSHSESSEDEQNNHNEYKNSVRGLNALKLLENDENKFLGYSMANSVATKRNDDYTAYKANNVQIIDNIPVGMPQRIIPKDAYFHELPNKKRDKFVVSPTLKNVTSPATTQRKNYMQNNQQLELATAHAQFYDTSSRFAYQNDQNHSNQMINANMGANTVPNMAPTDLYSAYDLNLTCPNENFTPVIQLPTNLSPRQNYMPYIERDISNDSGVSTHFYGGPLGPSPSLSPQTYFPSPDLRTPENSDMNYQRRITQSPYDERIQEIPIVRSGNVEYTMGNISSLV